MSDLKITADDVSILAAAHPDLISQCIYLKDTLTGPDNVIAELAKKLKGTAWSSAQAGWLDSCKQTLKIKIDADAENERLKYITNGVGQTMTYQQKIEEAKQVKAGSDPQISDYPILSQEIGITAPTLIEVADTVLAAFQQFQVIGGMIEGVRLAAKRDIDGAQTIDSAQAIYDALLWPNPILLKGVAA